MTSSSSNSLRLYESSECQNYNCWTSLTHQSTVPSSLKALDHTTGADYLVAGDKLTVTTQVKSTTKDDSDDRHGHCSIDQNVPTPPTEPFDLSTIIPGMYRILDLISEQGSGGLGKLNLILPEAKLIDNIISGQNHYCTRFSSRLRQYPVSWGVLLHDQG